MPVIVKSSFAKRPTLEEPGLLGIKIEANEPRSKNIHVGLLFDCSGSMEGDRIISVKRTISVLLDLLNIGDVITLVGFSDTAQIILNAVTVTSDNKLTMLESIDKLTANGGTNLEVGVVGLGQLLKEQSVLNALVVLTDGHLNDGVTSVAGLYSLITSYMKSVPVYTLGYGEDHNADLLKNLSSRTRANYTFIQDEIVLPISMGDMLGALQTEVASEASIKYDPSWTCIEPLAVPDSEYNIGSLIADKATWVIFKVTAGSEAANFTLSYKDEINNLFTSRPGENEIAELEIVEQYVRCITGATLNSVSEAMRLNKLVNARDLLISGLSAINSSKAARRPLVIRMKAQLEETLEEVNKAINRPPMHRGFSPMTPAALLNRTTSLGGNYSAQRGVTQMADGHTPGLFSNSSQEQASNHMAAQYSVGGGDPLAHS